MGLLGLGSRTSLREVAYLISEACGCPDYIGPCLPADLLIWGANKKIPKNTVRSQTQGEWFS